MTAIRYLPSIHWENFHVHVSSMNLCGIYLLLKIIIIIYPEHVIDVMSILNAFHSSNQTKLLTIKLKHPKTELYSLFFMFILNTAVEQTKFIWNWGSISRRDLTISWAYLLTFMTWQQCKFIHLNLTYMSSGIPMEFEKLSEDQSTTFKRYVWCFLLKIGCHNIVSNSDEFYLFLRFPQHSWGTRVLQMLLL